MRFPGFSAAAPEGCLCPQGHSWNLPPPPKSCSTAAGASSRSSPSVPDAGALGCGGLWRVGLMLCGLRSLLCLPPSCPPSPQKNRGGFYRKYGGAGGILNLLNFGPTGLTLCGPRRWGRKGAGPCSGTRSAWRQFLGVWRGHLHGSVRTVLMIQHHEVDTHTCPVRRAACQPPSPENLAESLVFLPLP